jgi:hypothetical protein
MTMSVAPGGEHRVLLLPATRRDGEAIAALLERHRIQCRVCLTVAEAAEAVSDQAGALVLTDQLVTDPSAPSHHVRLGPPAHLVRSARGIAKQSRE